MGDQNHQHFQSKSTLSFVKENVLLFSGLVAWLLIGGITLLWFDKVDIHLYINKQHSAWADVFFKYATHLGDGLFGSAVVLLLLLFRFKLAISTLIAFAGSGLFTQVLKRQIFDDHFRPSKFFADIADLHFVEGVALHSSYSFPSGHSTASFSIFIVLALISKNKLAQVICIITAILSAFSRVYLSQHFFEDIYVGSIIGSLFAISFYLIFRNKSWGEEGLIHYLETKLKS